MVRSAVASSPGRVFGYIRVSTAGQATEGTSLEGQRGEVERCAATHGLSAPDIRTEVEGAGEERQEKRVVLNALLAGLRAGDVLIVPKIDRFSRDTIFTLTQAKKMTAIGARLISASENLDPSNDDGYMYLTIQASFAQREKARIKERTIGSRRRLRAEGLHVEGTTGLGYTRNKKTKRREIVPEDAEIVRFIFAQSIEGLSSRSIHGEVLARFGRKVSPANVSAILKNRVYLGEMADSARQPLHAPRQFGVWRPAHDAIIDRATFERARRAAEERAKKGRPSTAWDTRNWLLRGIAKCSLCEAAAYARPYKSASKTTPASHDGYYYCRRRMNPGVHEERCPNGVIERRDRVDAQVDALVVARLESLRAELMQHAEAASAPKKPKIDLEGGLKRIAAKRERWLEAFGDGSLTRDELKLKIGKLEAERATLEVQAREEQERLAVVSPAERVRRQLELEGVAKLWERAGPEQRRRIIGALATRALIEPGGELRFTWKRGK
jgi:DNA invertase Pin-like site-specific DNA recombinase